MHGAGARTLAVAALVVVVKAPMLLLHYMSMTFFLNEAHSTALSSSHDSTFCKSRSTAIQCGRSCSASSGGHRVRGSLRFGSHDASSKLPCVNHVDHLVAQGSTGLRNMLSKRVLRMLQRLATASQQPRRWCRSGSGGGA